MGDLYLSIDSIHALLAMNGSLMAIRDDALESVNNGGRVIVQQEYENADPETIAILRTADEVAAWIATIVPPET